MASMRSPGSSLRSAALEIAGKGERLSLAGEDRKRYLASISIQRPYALELLYWNCNGWSREAELQAVRASHTMSLSEASSVAPFPVLWDMVLAEGGEPSDRATLLQLECLKGTHRCECDGGPGGGLRWLPMKLGGIFLRHKAGGGMVWLPEGGNNFLVQGAAGAGWALVESARLVKRVANVDSALQRDRELGSTALHREAYSSSLARWHRKPRVHNADPLLTEAWLQAADDLRRLWHWDWRPLRQTSAFQVAQAKGSYTAGYPLSDAFHGFFGEYRWCWKFVEDGEGALVITNLCWREQLSLRLKESEVVFVGLDGEPLLWDALNAVLFSVDASAL